MEKEQRTKMWKLYLSHLNLDNLTSQEKSPDAGLSVTNITGVERLGWKRHAAEGQHERGPLKNNPRQRRKDNKWETPVYGHFQ